MIFGQLIEYNMRNIFPGKAYTKCEGERVPEKWYTKCGRERVPDSTPKNKTWAYLWINSFKVL